MGLFLLFSLFQQLTLSKYVYDKILPMTEFEFWTSGIGSDQLSHNDCTDYSNVMGSNTAHATVIVSNIQNIKVYISPSRSYFSSIKIVKLACCNKKYCFDIM